MKRNIYPSSGKVQCRSCNNYHYQWWMISHRNHKLSAGCASYMNYNFDNNSYYIYCSYGSAYDGEHFKVHHNLLSSHQHINAIERLISQTSLDKEPVICDKCIKRFINTKQISLVSSF